MKLTNSFCVNLKATSKVRKFSDGGGLYLFLSTIGEKLWRMGYRFEGKQKTLSFGVYPAVGLKAARDKREEAKELLAAGVDPGTHKQALKASREAETRNAFELVAREWLEKKKPEWTPGHSSRVLARLEKDIFPFVGDKGISSISAPEVLEMLRRIEAREAFIIAKRAKQTCGQIWRYAVATSRAERDITVDLKDALTSVKTTNFASIKEPKAIGTLLRDIDAYDGNLIVRLALRMAPYVFVRPGELRQAEWAEFNFEGTEGAEWKIPAAKMKVRQPHIVPLAWQVLAILEELRPYTGEGKYLFPSVRANSASISNMTLLAGLRRLGYSKEEMTVHGFRSMASTRLNEMGVNPDFIEVQLAHKSGSVRAIYNHAQWLPERRRMMQQWADYLDELRAKVT
jgi:integrase